MPHIWKEVVSGCMESYICTVIGCENAGLCLQQRNTATGDIGPIYKMENNKLRNFVCSRSTPFLRHVRVRRTSAC
jgi:hypothetical protein